MTHPPFVPVGLPRESQPDDSTDQRVGLHLLEALDSLDAVYKSAAFFAEVATEAAIGEFTLTRCLESVHATQGALLLRQGDRLVPSGDRGGALALLVADELVRGERGKVALFHNGADAAPLLVAGAPPHNVLTCPIVVGTQLLGTVVALADAACTFSTADAKLATAVASQAAIAMARARLHQEAELERQKLREVVGHHPDGIAVLDAAGRTTLCNPIARTLLGGDDALAILGRHLTGCTPASLCLGNGEHEVQLGAPPAARFVQLRAAAIGDGNVVLTLRDLTHKRREERLKRNFLSLLSHKLRTPLTAIVCAVDLLPQMPPADQDECLGEMRRRTDDLTAMIDRLFAFTELLEGSWSTQGSCDLRTLQQEWTQTPPTTATPNTDGRAPLAIEWDVADDAAIVPVPPARLRVALANLLDNVAKFAAPTTPWARVEARCRGDEIVIAVEDRGPGIPAAERAQLFETGHQIDAEFTGNVAGVGIGLTMVREITTRLGGRLELRDAVPHGCRFEMTFPRRRPETPR
jgi:signal transduction histidine kinase